MARRRWWLLMASLLFAGIMAGALAGILRGSSAPAVRAGSGRPSSAAQAGWPFHRRVPAIRLETSHGRRLSLRALQGRVVVLAPSLTLCHEICPLTTQAFISMRGELARQGLSGRVAFVEATVDPWRDSPARLRAYARLTGADFIQLTGPVAQVRRFWNYFGIGFRRVPQGKPPDMDWWTHRPETFDVEHVDGVFLIDQQGYERRFYPGLANVDGRLKAGLRRLLSSDGLKNLAHPLDAWSEPQVLEGIRRLLAANGSAGA